MLLQDVSDETWYLVETKMLYKQVSLGDGGWASVCV